MGSESSLKRAALHKKEGVGVRGRCCSGEGLGPDDINRTKMVILQRKVNNVGE